MQFLSKPESMEWATRRCPGAILDFRSARVTATRSIENLPPRALIHIAHELRHWLAPAPGRDMLVWVRETGIWPSNEDLPLYSAWRGKHGDDRSVEMAPGHVVGEAESASAITLMWLAVAFGWGFSAMSEGCDSVANIDHDGRVWLTAGDTQAQIEGQAVLKRIALLIESS